MAELPAEIRDRFVSDSGRFLVRVYSRGDIWDMESLQRFVADVESVDGRITGHPIQTYYASRQMQQSYLHSAIYALFAVMIVLVIDFRSIGNSLLAMLPLALGIWLLVGIMGLLDIPFNAANMIVLPLILGIGIDSGVHIVHDYRSQGSKFRLTNSVAGSIVICSATTMTGFCSMIFASHLGLRSLGQVLVLGLFCSLVSSLLFLPAWILARPVRDRVSQVPDANAAGRPRYRRNRIAGSLPSSSDSQAASLPQRTVPAESLGAVVANRSGGIAKKSAT
jgi:predicted RND superfamily exporter protein